MPNDSLLSFAGIKVSDLANATVVTAKTKATTEPGIELDAPDIAIFIAVRDKKYKLRFNRKSSRAKRGMQPTRSCSKCLLSDNTFKYYYYYY
jgi:hypothetical protein